MRCACSIGIPSKMKQNHWLDLLLPDHCLSKLCTSFDVHDDLASWISVNSNELCILLRINKYKWPKWMIWAAICAATVDAIERIYLPKSWHGIIYVWDGSKLPKQFIRAWSDQSSKRKYRLFTWWTKLQTKNCTALFKWQTLCEIVCVLYHLIRLIRAGFLAPYKCR